jgi:tetratricopeptide (TPR) repeat protein
VNDASSPSDSSAAGPPAPSRPKKPYRKAIGPKLRVLYVFVLLITALLGANSLYLGGVKAMGALTEQAYQDQFWLWMIVLHVVLGILVVAPFLFFGIVHWRNTKDRKNRRAVNIGYALFAICNVVLATGFLLLMRLGIFDTVPWSRAAIYWAHVACPLAAIWLYWLHRLVGPPIQWRVGLGYGGLMAVMMVALFVLKSQDPRNWNARGPASGDKYFQPSLASTSTGNFIPAEVLMADNYCLKCHEDAYKGWFHSAHHFSSFNNPPYLASVKETREFSMKRDGNVHRARWCAGCHDPAPFFSGAFDDPNFDMEKHPTAHAGITCTSCHAISHVGSTRGNADYTIEEPLHYPFAFSDNSFLQAINEQLIKAKPEFHKKTFLKPFHKTAEFCSTCHKVHLPNELNDYKEFLRGQNHYDPFVLSGVSGGNARSFYYPPKAAKNCNDCHMPLEDSNDFAAKHFENFKEKHAHAANRSIHDHAFPGANTGIPYLLRDQGEGFDSQLEKQKAFLKGIVRVDIFGLKEGSDVGGKLTAPLRPSVPALRPGEAYVLESVIRTLKVGHVFTQGTADSNEVWMDVTVKSGDRIIGRSGGLDERKEVDPWSHFINVFMLDREGNRIDRRNPQNIYVPLYNHQIPPGAGQVVHFGLKLPKDVSAPVQVNVKLQYRKFDQRYMEFTAKNTKAGSLSSQTTVTQSPSINDLPIITLAEDSITFPVEGVEAENVNSEVKIPAWERWNDYGIGLLLEGTSGESKGNLRQAAEAFAEVEKLGRCDGPLNQARAYFQEGDLAAAVEALGRVKTFTDPPAPTWTVAWLSGLVNKQQNNLDAAISNFEQVVDVRTQEMINRGFDFSKDYEIQNELGQTLFERGKMERGEQRQGARDEYFREAITRFQKTLAIDSENASAHYNLSLIYELLGEEKSAEFHRTEHQKYKADDNAKDVAIRLARQKYPAANFAAEAIVVYPLRRIGGYELPSVEGDWKPPAQLIEGAKDVAASEVTQREPNTSPTP